MGVYIEGMEMPTSCADCRFAVDGWCYACPPESKAERKRIATNYCPLVPVQPHGDLIDRDALEEHDGWIRDSKYFSEQSSHTHIQFVFAKDIIDAPTIIPESGE